jgi:hypothetical protein
LEVNEWNGVTEPRLLLRQVRSREEPDNRPSVEEETEVGELVLFA